MNSKAVSTLLWAVLLCVAGTATASQHDINYICDKLSIYSNTFTRISNVSLPFQGATTADGFSYSAGSLIFFPSTSNISASACKMYNIGNTLSVELELFQGINITLHSSGAYYVAEDTTIKMVFRVYKQSNYYIIKPALSEISSLGRVTTNDDEDVTDEAEVIIRPIFSNNFNNYCIENFTFSVVDTDTGETDWMTALKIILKNSLLGLYKEALTH